jgi:hypothetical protein
MTTISKLITFASALVISGLSVGPAAAQYLPPSPPPTATPPYSPPWHMPPRDFTVPPSGPTMHVPYGPGCSSCNGPEPFERESSAPLSDAPTRDDMERDTPTETPDAY